MNIVGFSTTPMLALLFLPLLSVIGMENDKDVPRLPTSVERAGKPAGEGQKIRLFILSGQSNMAALTHQLFIVPALEKAFPEDSLIIVKHSKSGQPIHRWYKDWQPVGDWVPRNKRMVPGNNDLFMQLMDMVKEATAELKPDSVSFMWMQGEADAKSGQSANYKESLAGLIRQIREDTGFPEATAVVGRLSDHLKDDPHWNGVRKAQMEVCDEDPHAAWIDTDDLNGTNEGLHYSGDGYAILGERFANATIKLLK
ncbi:MAG: sialate O-acetylesterase [Kiritimatiellia bacterium]